MMFYHLNNVHISLQILITCLPVVMSVSNDSALFVSKLLEGYDYRLSPNFGTDQATDVYIGSYIVSLDSVDERNMDYQATLFFRQMWTDSRLSYQHMSNKTSLTLDQIIVDQIWTPDPYFYNEKQGRFHMVTKPNRMVRLFPDGGIFFSTRISVKLSCQMKLQKFPLDTQMCGIIIESYAYTSNELDLKWDGDDPVKVEDLQLPQFHLIDVFKPSCFRVYSIGNFSCLEVFFIMKREISFYLIQTFVPTSLIVILSWVSFWIGIESVPGRISLGLLTILTMAQQTASVSESSPKVSYIKAIDVWMSTCMIFVFGSLLEFAFVNYLFKKETRRPLTKEDRSAYYQENTDATADDPELVRSSSSGFRQDLVIYDVLTQQRALKIDRYAKICFPVAFLIFNIVFWTFYTI